MENAVMPSVGLVWGVPNPDGSYLLLFDTKELTRAETYGDCLTDARGHVEIWDAWQRLSSRELKAIGVPLLVKAHPYDHWPRGRVVYQNSETRFVILADRRLQRSAIIKQIKKAFCLEHVRCIVESDAHYRSWPLL